MSIFTIAIIVYVVLMIILEVIQGGRKRKIPPAEEFLEKRPPKEVSPLKETTKVKTPPPGKEETLPEETVETGEGVTLEYTKEKLEESKEGESLEYKEEKIEEKITEVDKRKVKKGILSLSKKDEILKLVIFKEIITPHPLTRRLLKRKL